MKKIFKSAAIIAAAASMVVSCTKTPEFVRAEKGPEMKVNSCTEATYMGTDIKFSVSLNDSEFALSTLKASLYYDETEVRTVTVRTKENGAYDCTINAPLFKDIPDGTATLVLAAQNVGLAFTYDTLYVALKRPDFETLTVESTDGKSYTMTKTSDYVYEATDNFPATLNAHVLTPVFDTDSRISFGWDGSSLSVGESNPIPFSAGLAGTYTIKVDLKSLTAGPTGTSDVVVTDHFEKGMQMDFGKLVDLNNWTIDNDFFEVDEDFTKAVFRAESGLYRMTYDTANSFIKVEPMATQDELQSLAPDGTGTPWVIGDGIGKPVIGPSWNTEDGAYPMAGIGNKTYRFTLTVPGQLSASSSNFKFFHQKGWGGEFTAGNYSSVEIGPYFHMTEDGNIHGDDVKSGKSYVFTLDLNGGLNAATLKVEEIEIASSGLDITVNGEKALKITNDIYKVTAVEIAQNSTISFSGIDNPLEWYVDPDHFSITEEGLKFNAVSGWYSFEMNLADKYVIARRVKSDGKAATFKDEGAITIMGWGVAFHKMTTQLAWESGALITLAEVEDGVYRFTGTAVEETDGDTVGGRWRYDYLSFKFFGQAGWGDEMGTVTLTDEAKKYLGLPSNIELVSEETKLELGATYVMTVTADNSGFTGGKFDCTVDFHKL
ncbi:MAG: DUF5121 domain-containing protein [Candidatus Cryptobacteroides sp.]